MVPRDFLIKIVQSWGIQSVLKYVTINLKINNFKKNCPQY